MSVKAETRALTKRGWNFSDASECAQLATTLRFLGRMYGGTDGALGPIHPERVNYTTLSSWCAMQLRILELVQRNR